MKKIKIAIVGCGRISKNHFDAVQKLNEGWDVLNLFDIVRLYEKHIKNKTISIAIIGNEKDFDLKALC